MEQLDDKRSSLKLLEHLFLSFDSFLFIFPQHGLFAQLLQRHIHVVGFVLRLVDCAESSSANALANFEVGNLGPRVNGDPLTGAQILYH